MNSCKLATFIYCTDTVIDIEIFQIVRTPTFDIQWIYCNTVL